jgi:hypothetical protein
MADIGHYGGIETSLLSQFAARYFQRVGLWCIFPRPLGQFPIATSHRVAKLLDEVQATVTLDRNVHYEMWLLHHAVDSAGAISTTDRVLAHADRLVLVDDPGSGSLDVDRFVYSQRQPGGSGGLIEKGRRVRAAIDDAHLTSQHIEEPRQIVNTDVAEIRTHSGHLRGSVPSKLGILRRLKGGAKRQRVKTPAADPDALLALKDGPRTLELDCDSDDCHQG